MRTSVGDVLLVAATTLVAFGLWSALDGGYAATVWYPAALLFLVLAAVLEWASDAKRLPTGLRLALGSLFGLTAWSYVSIAWAHDRGIALTGANRTLAYLLVFLVVVRRSWTRHSALAYALVWAVVVVSIGVVDLVAAGAGTGDVLTGFTVGRLARPIEYANANAALFVLAAWPLVWVGQFAKAPVALRAIAFAFGGTAVELAFLTQSRGAALALAATLVLVLLMLPNRLRLGVTVATIAAVVAVAHVPLLGLYERINNGDRPHEALRAAELAIAGSAGTFVAVGVAMALLDRMLRSASANRQRLIGQVASVAAAVVVAGFGAAALELYGNPISVAQRAWHAFKYPADVSSTSSHFLTSAGNHRYDFWRVAAGQFWASPVLGAGVDNFAADYVARRRSSEEPLYPHSVEASLLGGTGLVGFLFFAAFAVTVCWRCFANARAQAGAGLAGAVGGTMLLYWLLHSSVDWLWDFPAVTGPTFAMAACGAKLKRTDSADSNPARLRPAVAVAAVPAALAAALVLGCAWIAARDTSLAVGRWRESPTASYALLRRAARLNPLSDEPYLVAGTIALRRHEWVTASGFFKQALARNDDDWYSHFAEGVASAKMGKRNDALAALRSARRLDPREPLIANVETAVVQRRRFSVDALDRTLADRASTHPH